MKNDSTLRVMLKIIEITAGRKGQKVFAMLERRLIFSGFFRDYDDDKLLNKKGGGYF